MGGAPTTPVIPADASNDNAAGASNRSMSATAPPVMRLAFITPVIPSTWDSGAAANCTSSAVIANASASARAFHAMPRWVSSAALASPVVPDVKMRTATSSSLTRDRGGRRGSRRRRQRGRPSPPRARCMPTSPRSAASAGVVTNTAAPATSSRCLTSRGFSRTPSGAATAPSRRLATNAPTNAGLFGSQIATHRPGRGARGPQGRHPRVNLPPEIAIRDPSASMEQRGPLRQTFARRLDEEREVCVCVLHARPRASDERVTAPRHTGISLPETCLGAARAVKRELGRATRYGQAPSSPNSSAPGGRRHGTMRGMDDDVDRERSRRAPSRGSPMPSPGCSISFSTRSARWRLGTA